ncbi:MAG: hypothetical protein KUG75_07300 [Pseudomonadales bacterium]|nr:hypothetical protein [Pseudomonadales bacterium]
MTDAPLPAFVLENSNAGHTSFPGERSALICFIKADCPTCIAIMPLLEACFRGMQDKIDIHLIGQTLQGNLELADKFDLHAPLLDDSTLKVSFVYDIEIVPTLIWAIPPGQENKRLEGFDKAEWEALLLDVVEQSQGSNRNTTKFPAKSESTGLLFDWATLPKWRPGCASLSADPVIAERLQAEADNNPLRARKIEIAATDDAFEFMYDQGFSDGLPLVPPTPERVLRMLSGTRREAQELIAKVPPNMGEATIEKIAVNAVMAGAKPEYLPVIIAALEAACTDEFNIHGVMATTMGASPVMVVNGPIREKIGMNMKLSALGQGNRANATIGRALRLAVRNIGGAKPGGTERSALGNPMKFTMCFAEWEERSIWSPLHVERGFNATDSVVTLFCMTSGPVLIVDQTSRRAAQIAGSMGMCLTNIFHPKAQMVSDTLLVVCPEHLDTLARDGYSKENLRNRIQEITMLPMADLVVDDNSGVGIPTDKFANMSSEMQQSKLPKFRSNSDIHIVVAGSDAGKFSGAFHGWATGSTGSISVSKKIEET